MGPLLFFVAWMMAIVYGAFIGRLYTGSVLPTLNEPMAFLPSRQLEQMRRYVELEERAGRKRWFFGLVRRAGWMALVPLVLAVAAVAVGE